MTIVDGPDGRTVSAPHPSHQSRQRPNGHPGLPLRADYDCPTPLPVVGSTDRYVIDRLRRMGAATALPVRDVRVDPGATTTAKMLVRNTGQVVDQYTIDVVGNCAPWTQVEPKVVNLLPGADVEVTITFAPGRGPQVPAGVVPFGIRVLSREDPPGSAVAEGIGRRRPVRRHPGRPGPPPVEGPAPGQAPGRHRQQRQHPGAWSRSRRSTRKRRWTSSSTTAAPPSSRAPPRSSG